MSDQLRFLRPFLRGLPLIVLAMVLAVLAAKKYLSYTTPMYESTAKLKLADTQEGVPSANLFKDFDVFVSPNKIAAEIEVLKSHHLLSKALDSLQFDCEYFRTGRLRNTELYGDSPFLVETVALSPKAYDRRIELEILSDREFRISLPGQAPQSGRFGTPVAWSEGQLLVHRNASYLRDHPHADFVGEYAFELLSREKLVGKVTQHLDIVAVDKDVAVIRVSFKSPIPEKAADFVNTLTRTYIEDYIQEKYRAAQTTTQFLSQQIDTVSGRLAQSENVIESFRNARNIINIHQETETNLRKVSQLKVQQTNVGMNLQGLQDFARYVASGKDDFLELSTNFDGYSDLLSTEMVKNIKQLQAEKNDLLLTYTPQEERVQVVDKKINDLKTYLLEGVENSLQMLATKYDRLSEDIRLAEGELIGIPTKEKQLNILNREFSLVEHSYNFLNGKKIEAEIAQAAKLAFHRILKPAVPSKQPVSPNRSIIVIVSAILGMMGAMGAIWLVHLAKGKVNDPHTIEQTSRLPIAVQTPRFTRLAQATRHFLREAIQLELKGIIGPECRLLVFSSQHTGEGRSFHAHHLACAFAAQGRRVLLLDASGSLDGLHTDPPYTYRDIRLLPGRHQPAAMRAYMDAALQEYELVIVNNEPMAEETFGLLLMRLAHSNLFVLDARKSPAKLIQSVDLLVEEFQLPALSFVLNRAGYAPSLLIAGYNALRCLLGHRQPTLR